MNMKYERGFEFEVDPKWVRLRFAGGTALALERVVIESEFTNPYELGTLDILATLDPLT